MQVGASINPPKSPFSFCTYQLLVFNEGFGEHAVHLDGAHFCNRLVPFFANYIYLLFDTMRNDCVHHVQKVFSLGELLWRIVRKVLQNFHVCGFVSFRYQLTPQKTDLKIIPVRNFLDPYYVLFIEQQLVTNKEGLDEDSGQISHGR